MVLAPYRVAWRPRCCYRGYALQSGMPAGLIGTPYEQPHSRARACGERRDFERRRRRCGGALRQAYLRRHQRRQRFPLPVRLFSRSELVGAGANPHPRRGDGIAGGAGAPGRRHRRFGDEARHRRVRDGGAAGSGGSPARLPPVPRLPRAHPPAGDGGAQGAFEGGGGEREGRARGFPASLRARVPRAPLPPRPARRGRARDGAGDTRERDSRGLAREALGRLSLCAPARKGEPLRRGCAVASE
mmetsp:Transcript_12514/g.41267  ORF Transcript_12514/g.41267 Transcript_12514/m.41267 type:complete len:244 (+) Transcript_12514:760-1491(+)